MSQEELAKLELELDSIDEMADIEDDMIDFLLSKEAIYFIDNTIELAFQQGGIKINKLVQNSEKMNEFKKSIQDHFKWIEKHIDDEDEDINNYRNSQSDVFKAYCLFYTKAITNIYNYLNETDTCKELIKYFKTLKSKYC